MKLWVGTISKHDGVIEPPARLARFVRLVEDLAQQLLHGSSVTSGRFSPFEYGRCLTIAFGLEQRIGFVRGPLLPFDFRQE